MITVAIKIHQYHSVGPEKGEEEEKHKNPDIIGLFSYCKGGTSWMSNKDWSTSDIDESWKWDEVLFKSNCIILHHYLSIDAKHII